MSLVFNAKTYTNDTARTPDLYRYLGTLHTGSNNDYVEMGRIAAKPTATFAGKARRRIKLVRGVTNGTVPLNTDVIADLTVSVPVGMASGELTTFITDFAAAVSAALFSTLVTTGKINQ